MSSASNYLDATTTYKLPRFPLQSLIMPTKTRSARPAANKRSRASAGKPVSRPTRRASTTKKRKASEDEEDDRVESSAEDDASEGYKDSDNDSGEEDAGALDSDALDEDDDVQPNNKRKRGGQAGERGRSKKASPRKRRKKDEDKEQEWDEEDEDGREIVGRVVEAPKTGRGAYTDSPQRTKRILRR